MFSYFFFLLYMAGSVLNHGAGSSILNRSPSFPRFLEIRCQAAFGAGLERPPPSGDRWLRTVDPNCLLPSRCEAVVAAARTKNQFRCVFLVADSVAT
jgi:hypothetical protein